MDANGNFKVVTYAQSGAQGTERATDVPESFIAADVAEDWLLTYGTPGSAYAEIRFNGDDEPHTMMFLLEKDEIGVWNTPSCKWPIFYPDHDQYGDQMLDGIPWEELENKLNEVPEAEGGRKESDDDADNMNLGLEDEDSDDDVAEDEDAEDEIMDDEEDDDEADREDDDSGEADVDEDSDDHDEDDFTPEEDGPDEGETEADTDTEDEPEMPRLNIFGKMRGPKGWRKRAEAVKEETRNVFALKVGVLPEDYDPENEDEARKPGELEGEVICHVEFIENDENRETGTLRIKLPTGVTLDDFTTTKSGIITAQVPYRKEDDESDE